MIIRLLIINIISLLWIVAKAEYSYTLLEDDNHRIHIVEISTEEYEVSSVAAHDQVFGRENVGDIVSRENAQLGINAGFFEIGNNRDGRPTGTLVSNGILYGLRVSSHGCFIKDGNNFKIETISPYIELSSGKWSARAKKYNRFVNNAGDIYYYNRAWGPTTLTSYGSRKEVSIDSTGRITQITEHGNNFIPDEGFIFSFPKEYDLSSLTADEKITVNTYPAYLFKKGNFAVMGLPEYLLKKGEINKNFTPGGERGARSAIGIKKNGNLILVVAEHIYYPDITSLTVNEVKKFFGKKNTSFTNMTSSSIVGLSFSELAKLMKNYGCTEAINLDGGGSSTLFIDGKYINNSIGDIDEALGQEISRPVSDAIIFKKR